MDGCGVSTAADYFWRNGYGSFRNPYYVVFHLIIFFHTRNRETEGSRSWLFFRYAILINFDPEITTHWKLEHWDLFRTIRNYVNLQ